MTAIDQDLLRKIGEAEDDERESEREPVGSTDDKEQDEEEKNGRISGRKSASGFHSLPRLQTVEHHWQLEERHTERHAR